MTAEDVRPDDAAPVRAENLIHVVRPGMIFILGQDSPQVRQIPYEGPVEDFPPAGADPPFRDRVRARCLHRSLDDPDADAPTVRFRYRRSLEDSPWSLSEAVLPAALAPRDWGGTESPFARLTRDTGIAVRRARRSFSADAATAEDARWLEVQPGAPLLIVAGVNTDAEGNDLAHIQHRTRADRAEYVVNLSV
jgi:UTRA domain